MTSQGHDLTTGSALEGFEYDPAAYHEPSALRRHADACAVTRGPLPETPRYLCRAADEIERLRAKLDEYEQREILR